LLSGYAYAAELFPKKELKLEEITNNWLKNKTVTDLAILGFTYRYERITTTEDSVQYYLTKRNDNGLVRVICFVDSKKTICRLP
jgi:hypothetical protein